MIDLSKIPHEAGCQMAIGFDDMLREGIDPHHSFVSNGKEFEECTICQGAPEDHECNCQRRHVVELVELCRNFPRDAHVSGCAQDAAVLDECSGFCEMERIRELVGQ